MAIKDYTRKLGKESNDYMTPKTIYQPILDFIGQEMFDLDVCCTEDNIPAFLRFKEEGLYIDTEEEKLPTKKCGLTAPWGGICFMNYPWAQPKWITKALKEVSENDCEAWCIVPGDRLNKVFLNSGLRDRKDWFIASLEDGKGQKFNFYNPHISQEENDKNVENGGFGKPIFILYIGKYAPEYAYRWKKEQPIRSLVLKP